MHTIEHILQYILGSSLESVEWCMVVYSFYAFQTACILWKNIYWICAEAHIIYYLHIYSTIHGLEPDIHSIISSNEKDTNEWRTKLNEKFVLLNRR